MVAWYSTPLSAVILYTSLLNTDTKLCVVFSQGVKNFLACSRKNSTMIEKHGFVASLKLPTGTGVTKTVKVTSLSNNNRHERK